MKLFPNRGNGIGWFFADLLSLPFSVIFYLLVGINRATGAVLERIFR